MVARLVPPMIIDFEIKLAILDSTGLVWPIPLRATQTQRVSYQPDYSIVNSTRDARREMYENKKLHNISYYYYPISQGNAMPCNLMGNHYCLADLANGERLD